MHLLSWAIIIFHHNLKIFVEYYIIEIFIKVTSTPRSRSQRSKNSITWKVMSQGIHMWNMEAIGSVVKRLSATFKFLLKNYNVDLDLQGQGHMVKLWYQLKALVIRMLHIKYESCRSNICWVINNWIFS